MLQVLLLKPAISFVCVLFLAEVQVMAIAAGCFVNDMEADENTPLGIFFQSVKYSRCIPEDVPRNTYGP